MAGHSKWANIQHRKGAQDKLRARIFTRLLREIAAAARVGGGDVTANSRLRLAVEKARAASMPRDTIERAIKRTASGADAAGFQAARYEGYGPGGAAVMIDCLTDNRNRTVADVRHAFTSHGGHLGADGSVSYLFQQVGVLSFAPGFDEDQLMDVALDAGAEDVVTNADASLDVLTAPGDFEAVRAALAQHGFAAASGEVTQRAATGAALTGVVAAEMLAMLEALENLDDVQHVYSNAEFPDELLARIPA
ncbi:MAG TPA: YebC/PmpR family DNA-binding transcriptional regulator [Steroidobacteraceae bacterium]|nr:YebC/PmpR family DNA-binding transcriptional regulator [Steroidobacteraceae bacterium]HQX46463.1 YebC/PmpR family DNA-binding transcriptional regulator [Steroidobacteraceae bacterium]HQX78201.1 YebC/PmpR family DNA-binding transcriptional regulator [Steroidobacteraceae bacterium]HQZ81088.1 YebC/PmpR family DNA-binding transcriptional regulator [Steroidobacteraceae bacterium]